MIDDVAHTMNYSWDKVYEMEIIAFFNVVSYIREKIRRDNEDLKKWTSKH